MFEDTASSNSGSHWQRWDPHTHAPGTLFNDQFLGDWEAYLTRWETATPPLRSLGITDYYSTDTYEQVCAAKASGRLPQCELIFPNVEMRLDVGAKRSFLNIHLLVDPTAPDHIGELQRFMGLLRFEAYEDTFSCRRDDLMRLGQRADPTVRGNDMAALRKGAEQFKVGFDQLRREYPRNEWARTNILVAVSGATSDGTGALRDAADTTLREEIEKFAHIIFNGNPKQRDFWLGLGALNPEQIRLRYDALKPCLHGSDAHSVADVGAPALNRYTWIKGAVSFETLQQAYIDPNRAYVGEQPPTGATPSQAIHHVSISNAPWAKTPQLHLNPGLIAIIGPRGSGKTALADIIARGCDATSERLSTQSFLERARPHLAGAVVTLTWGDGTEPEPQALDNEPSITWELPRARYLSQKFVEELCAAHGMTDELLREIERVVFESHTMTAREGATDFGELVDLRAGRYRQSRVREELTLANVSDQLGVEFEKEKLVKTISDQVTAKNALIARYVADRTKLVAKGSAERLTRLEAVTAAAEAARGNVRILAAREQAFLALRDEVDDFRNNQSPASLRQMQERYAPSGLKGAAWQPFLLDYSGDVDATMSAGIKETRERATAWRGAPPTASNDESISFLKLDADLKRTPLALLEAEIGRLQKLISGDRMLATQFMAISKRIDEETASLARLKERLADCQQARERITALRTARQEGYTRVFEAVLAEQAVLSELYAPLMARIGNASGALVSR